MSADDLARILAPLPTGTMVSVGFVREHLTVSIPPSASPEPARTEEPTWRERLWTCPEETRLGVAEIAEALGRSKSWVYKRTMAVAQDRLPVRRLDGEVVVTAGDLRGWIDGHEESA